MQGNAPNPSMIFPRPFFRAHMRLYHVVNTPKQCYLHIWSLIQARDVMMWYKAVYTRSCRIRFLRVVRLYGLSTYSLFTEIHEMLHCDTWFDNENDSCIFKTLFTLIRCLILCCYLLLLTTLKSPLQDIGVSLESRFWLTFLVCYGCFKIFVSQ